VVVPVVAAAAHTEGMQDEVNSRGSPRDAAPPAAAALSDAALGQPLRLQLSDVGMASAAAAH
jgi:hypothetical protein